MPIDTVDIRPGVNVLSVLRHLNYKPWFALAEFVDNALQSYQSNYEALKEINKANGKQHRLEIRIDIDSTRISIRDNAAGIGVKDYKRAFRPAEVPPDASGLSEFGMGMKSAACWFAPIWTVRTSALGEDIIRQVTFNIDNIVNDSISELEVTENSTKAHTHFTEIKLSNLHNNPTAGRTLGKIKEHLTHIYRDFTRRGDVMIFLNGGILLYKELKILNAPYFKTPDAEAVKWKKPINLDLGNDLKVTGFAGLRDPGSTTHAGFALFRRGRLIQGSGDEGYRPQAIFGHSNSYRYQRLFGELHLEGFQVSHTKDGFQWDDNEESFLDLLKKQLDDGDKSLLKQADGYRATETKRGLEEKVKPALNNTADVMIEHMPPTLPELIEKPPVDTSHVETPHKEVVNGRIFDIDFREVRWRVNIEVTNDEAESEWLVLNDIPPIEEAIRKIDIRVCLAHPFSVRFAGDSNSIEILLRMGAAIAISEVIASDIGIKNASTVRRGVNDLLFEVFSKPAP